MNRFPLPSPMLRSVGYEAVTTTLEIEFSSGCIWRYFGVPERRYQSLMAADCPASYLEQHIKQVFRAEKVAPQL